MIHKRLIWVMAPVLLTMLLSGYGCTKKKPATKPSDLNVETMILRNFSSWAGGNKPATTAP